MVANPDATKGRCLETQIRDGRIDTENAFGRLPKPIHRSEEALKKVVDNLLPHLTCAKIIAACKEGNGLIDTSIEFDK
ncbi:hypothetical protein [Dongia mobilis]|uniref:hypothetical protein n=1 Tax=Dongia mobilis TaxID=578943 RepID=UPI00105CECFB|nr:hypothetical protein [Dongia mobilis]